MPEHANEIREELPCFIELSQQDGHELIDIEHYLVEEINEKLRIDVRQHFPERFSGHISWIVWKESVPECRVISGEAVLDDVCEVVEDQFLVLAVLLLLNRDNYT